MDISPIEIIIDNFCLGSLIDEPVQLSSHLFYLHTTCGEFCLKPLNYKNLYQQPVQGETIARAMLAHNLPVVSALLGKNGFICSTEDKVYMVFPWCTGQVLPAKKITLEQAYQIGQLLGRIHKINLQLPNIKSASWYDFIAPDWEVLINQSDLAKQLQHHINQLNIWTQQYHNAYEKLEHNYVISHGDLTPTNVVWKTTNDPWIIDWESAGWIHPHIELFGVALNWANIDSSSINSDNFQAVINGYQSILGNTEINQIIVSASLGSWLKWIIFNLQFTQLDKESRLLEIERTIAAIKQINNFL